MGCFLWRTDANCGSLSSSSGSSMGSGRGTTIIANKTQFTIVFKDKHRGDRFGPLRHRIGPNSAKQVSVDVRGTETYYRMGLLLDEPEQQDTHFCIDTEDLLMYSRITISSSGDKLVVAKDRPRQSTSVLA